MVELQLYSPRKQATNHDGVTFTLNFPHAKGCTEKLYVHTYVAARENYTNVALGYAFHQIVPCFHSL